MIEPPVLVISIRFPGDRTRADVTPSEAMAMVRELGWSEAFAGAWGAYIAGLPLDHDGAPIRWTPAEVLSLDFLRRTAERWV